MPCDEDNEQGDDESKSDDGDDDMQPVLEPLMKKQRSRVEA